ncbi:molybdenum import ATP-binding protein ModC [Mycolicibacterium doricum]|uniref:Molybdenum ABC transporter ATP-binding protein n=1 Tax=Mycolicibacterium doricum TaxID=126673 RepID=A0A1X1SXB7_9MYCO|nr:ATP-binding cassette domain-containing protein [Mycolicibacterium doricum]MCV7269353.1 ATP-binding cassette domain-containing protein [Mycolicibacterium doricum]ORV35658.1 molybdenum ABC transporter ATP-binding protein [Mycolicibacterium doricum]BBZ07889.1 molybdenum import ATP-binding protein ModC [Mycolicibacterium doricum]
MTGLAVRARVEHREVDVEFAVGAGEVLAVLGPNGAGKTTALHVIAGVVRPDDGVVRVGDRVITDTAAGVHVPTHRRRVGLLLQDPLLFPHLRVAANVAFGARSGRSRAQALACGNRWLGEVGAVDLAGRMPRQLSGGQAQRVALARALAAEPDVLLLDEPLAGLDVTVAGAMRRVLRQVLTRDGRSAVLVTHDLVDVATLADRVAVIDGGRVTEAGPAASVLTAPRSPFGAQFAGVNLVAGVAGRGGVVRAGGVDWHGVATADVVIGEPAVAIFRPAAVAVYRERPQGSPRNTVEVVVAEVDSSGPAVRVRAGEQAGGAPGLTADITAESAAALRLTPGDRIHLAVKAQEVALYPGP